MQFTRRCHQTWKAKLLSTYTEYPVAFLWAVAFSTRVDMIMYIILNVFIYRYVLHFRLKMKKLIEIWCWMTLSLIWGIFTLFWDLKSQKYLTANTCWCSTSLFLALKRYFWGWWGSLLGFRGLGFFPFSYKTNQCTTDEHITWFLKCMEYSHKAQCLLVIHLKCSKYLDSLMHSVKKISPVSYCIIFHG